jgi:archaellum component FlaC
MKIKTRYFEVLANIRKLSHNRSNIFINREEIQKKLFEICRNYLLVRPDAEHDKHRTYLARLLYENLYRGLYLYLQGAGFKEEYINIEREGEISLDSRILEEDDSFLEIQKNDLKLQMGLLAYADASTGWQLRYLYGPHDLPEDRLKTFPHFYIKPFYCHEREGHTGRYEFKSVDQVGFWGHSSTLYYSRTNIDYRNLDFVQILQAKKGSSHLERRTRFERDFDIIYSPDGEMGACILSWLMLCIAGNKVRELDAALSLPSQDKIMEYLEQIKFKINLEDHAVMGFATSGSKELEPLPTWESARREENLFYWLYKLGLIKDKETRNKQEITERGQRLVKWLNLYLRSLGGEELSILGYKELTYYRIIRGVQKIYLSDFKDKGREFMRILHRSKENKGTLAYAIYRLLKKSTRIKLHCYLESGDKEPDNFLIKEIIDTVNKFLEAGEHYPWERWLQLAFSSKKLTDKMKHIREPYCRRRMILEAHFPGCISKPSEFFPSWLDGIDRRLVDRYIQQSNGPQHEIRLAQFLHAVHLFIKWNQWDNDNNFKKRCRFNLLGHLTLRAGRHRQEHIETASRAWIVFPVHYDYTDYQENSVVTSVGFFLGTFKDSTDNGYGCFEHFNKLGPELTERIFKIRQIMDLLAQVENREIYIRDIYNIQIQEAMENQHKWTIHEISNEIPSIIGDINNFKIENIKDKSAKMKDAIEVLEKDYKELELVFNWVKGLMNGMKIKNDEQWVGHEDLKESFEANFLKFIKTKDIASFFKKKDKKGVPLFEENHDEVFNLSDNKTKYYLPFFTYQKLLQELAKNIKKYADRNKKCCFKFFTTDNFIIITIRNTYARNSTSMLSTGKGLQLFERFLKVYNSSSHIDRSGVLNKNVGDECICKVYISIKKGGKKNDF